ncbi:MAG: tRNA epoxyqueuosine(34) reductase QueG [Pseudomonadales bacterium]
MNNGTHNSTDTLPSQQQVRSWAEALGFQAVGFSDVDLAEHEPHVREFLAAGFAGDMGYLQRNLDKRLHPERLAEGTVCVITARMNYLAADTQPIEVLQDASSAYVSRYALGRDYHKVLRKRLARLAMQIDAALPGHKHRAFTDSAPVLEKALAAKSGLGWMGKHSLILDQQAGSWFFLGEIYTNAPFATDSQPVEDACGKCNACITVCPTQAIIGPRKLDARRCISYLTIEHKGTIPVELRAPMGNRIYGCDDCQLYCPWNREAPTTEEADFQPRHQLQRRTLLELFEMDEAAFLKLTEGSAIRRIAYEQWQRNLAVALGNGPASPAVITALRSRLGSVSAMVDEHIQWALQRLAD